MGKYYLTEEIKPNIDTLGNVAYTNDDVLFDVLFDEHITT